MGTEASIEDLIDWIISKRIVYGWTYTDLASMTGYSISGVKKSLREKTMKYQAIEKIVKENKLEEEFLKVKRGDTSNKVDGFVSTLNKAETDYKTLKDRFVINDPDELLKLALQCISNMDRMKSMFPFFENAFELEVYKRMLEVKKETK